MTSRSITVHNEPVGEPRDGWQDTIVAEVSYSKGRGYELVARVQQNDDFGTEKFLLVSGIAHRSTVATVSRFGKRKLQALADESPIAVGTVVAALKVELERRIAAGEDY